MWCPLLTHSVCLYTLSVICGTETVTTYICTCVTRHPSESEANVVMTHTIRGTEPANSQPRPSWLWPTPWSVRTQDCVSFNVFIFGFLSTAPTPAAFCCCPLLSWPHSGSWTLQLLPWSLLMQPRFDNHVNPCPSVNTKIYRGLGTGRVFWSPWEQELWVSLKLWCKINLIPTRSKGKDT